MIVPDWLVNRAENNTTGNLDNRGYEEDTPLLDSSNQPGGDSSSSSDSNVPTADRPDQRTEYNAGNFDVTPDEQDVQGQDAEAYVDYTTGAGDTVLDPGELDTMFEQGVVLNLPDATSGIPDGAGAITAGGQAFEGKEKKIRSAAQGLYDNLPDRVKDNTPRVDGSDTTQNGQDEHNQSTGQRHSHGYPGGGERYHTHPVEDPGHNHMDGEPVEPQRSNNGGGGSTTDTTRNTGPTTSGGGPQTPPSGVRGGGGGSDIFGDGSSSDGSSGGGMSLMTIAAALTAVGGGAYWYFYMR